MVSGVHMRRVLGALGFLSVQYTLFGFDVVPWRLGVGVMLLVWLCSFVVL